MVNFTFGIIRYAGGAASNKRNKKKKEAPHHWGIFIIRSSSRRPGADRFCLPVPFLARKQIRLNGLGV